MTIKEILQSKELTDNFIQDNKNLAVSAIKSAFPSILSTYDADDYIQEGLIWLYRAMLKYDETKGIKFSTFAFTVIRRKIMQKAKYAQNKIKQYDKNVVSIYKFIDVIPDRNCYTNIVDTTYQQKVINRLREKLKGRNREIFEYILQKKTPLEMAEIKGCSKSNIYEIIKTIKMEADFLHEKVFKTA